MASKMYVLISHTGDYDDYRTRVIMVSNHKHVLEAHAAKLLYESALEIHVQRKALAEVGLMYNQALSEIADNEPKFNKSKQQDKAYQKMHMLAKQAWREEYNQLCSAMDALRKNTITRVRSEVTPEHVDLKASVEHFTVEEVDVVNEMPVGATFNV